MAFKTIKSLIKVIHYNFEIKEHNFNIPQMNFIQKSYKHLTCNKYIHFSKSILFKKKKKKKKDKGKKKTINNAIKRILLKCIFIAFFLVT